jgi:hypothetical protein
MHNARNDAPPRPRRRRAKPAADEEETVRVGAWEKVGV